ncbi:unnamed protein product [Linum tenue]|uniref:Prolamin-like domain-containing protein n=1 Tax=Linum tenue TaxID=586396 RepID=A0AAV0N0T1_9ROSI|nr:unnamed protein product [Linum tenue]
MKLVTPFILLLLALHPSSFPTAAAARDLTTLPTSTWSSASSTSSPPSTSLASRLKYSDAAAGGSGDGEETSNCWESLTELQACSGEIILFFLNGETYLGQGCCRAIRVIGRHCWPHLMGTLGFTDEESDVLEGYCDRADDDDGDDGEDGGDGGSPAPPNHHSPPASPRHVVVVP